MSRRGAFLPALVVALLAGGAALGSDGALADAFAQALRGAFGGTISAASAADGQALVWNATTRTWGPGDAGGSQTLAEVLAEGADGNQVSQTNLGSLALASGKTITGGTLTWTSWTPTGSWSTNTTYTGYRARIGNDLLARVKITLSGDPGAGALTINLPSGLTIDTTAHASPAVSAAVLGYGQGLDAGTLAYPLTVSYHSSDTLVVVNALASSGSYAACSNASAVSDVPFDWQSGDSLGVEFRVTCTGW